MNNRNQLLKEKEEHLQKQLQKWAKKNNFLHPGEVIEFSLTIKKTPIIVKGEENILLLSISHLKLSTRAYSCLTYNNLYSIETLGELADKTSEEVSEIPNCGKVTLYEIESKLLKKFGLRFRDRPTNYDPEDNSPYLR